MLARVATVLVAVGLVACTAPVDSSAGTTRASLIYGDDDRYEVSEPGVGDDLYEAARAVAAVIPRSRVRAADDETPQITALALGDAEQLCEGERFAAQPSVAECTAVLIDDNLLATAGHCFTHAFDCENYLFVFDYFYEAGDEQLGPLPTYECRQTRVRADDAHGRAPRHDYAIVELTQRVEGRTPLALREAPVETDEPMVVISSTGGVPLKVDLGARVLDPREEAGDYFVLESDTFYGSSGAPVLDHDGSLVGLFARGQRDYVRDDDAGCYRVARLPPLTTDASQAGLAESAEHASFAGTAIAAICATDYPSERLCGIAPACGDGICSPNEDTASCKSDCPDSPKRMRDLHLAHELAQDATASGLEARSASTCSAAPRRAAARAWIGLAAGMLAVVFAGRQRRKSSALGGTAVPEFAEDSAVLGRARCSRAPRACIASSTSISSSTS